MKVSLCKGDPPTPSNGIRRNYSITSMTECEYKQACFFVFYLTETFELGNTLDSPSVKKKISKPFQYLIWNHYPSKNTTTLLTLP